jgi:hypothetical protein
MIKRGDIIAVEIPQGGEAVGRVFKVEDTYFRVDWLPAVGGFVDCRYLFAGQFWHTPCEGDLPMDPTEEWQRGGFDVPSRWRKVEVYQPPLFGVGRL